MRIIATLPQKLGVREVENVWIYKGAAAFGKCRDIVRATGRGYTESVFCAHRVLD